MSSAGIQEEKEQVEMLAGKTFFSGGIKLTSPSFSTTLLEDLNDDKNSPRPAVAVAEVIVAGSARQAPEPPEEAMGVLADRNRKKQQRKERRAKNDPKNKTLDDEYNAPPYPHTNSKSNRIFLLSMPSAKKVQAAIEVGDLRRHKDDLQRLSWLAIFSVSEGKRIIKSGSREVPALV
eukprot:CAMPEP_0194582550 /NCGR_PEP_ID=MMETSP0292-20121207/15692_1 /TAXON_ID=39354 /ORGANISM="Heterosigma akashiwo, Strain CCMP2393" /LENGTH=176 /DNA_ID=CAMNT_0039436765 /DNA_START=59 /DNA_END=588 /DNA_ORIENTATION=+